MQEERKLKLALPRGQLIKPEKWNVGNVLEVAGIGRYHRGQEITFDSFDPEIDATVLKAVDIPRDVSQSIWDNDNICLRSVYDAGITGRDLVVESGFNLEEVCDLHCGYVDLFFMTTQEKMIKLEDAKEGIQTDIGWERKHTISKHFPIPKDMDVLESFLYYLSRNSQIRCRTEYKTIAESALERIRRKLGIGKSYAKGKDIPFFYFAVSEYLPGREDSLLERFAVESSRGQTEEHLVRGATDIILEAVATGDSARKRDLVLLGKVMDSTARLYADKGLLKNPIGIYLWNWKKGKLTEVRDRIRAATDDIGNHCQVEFTIRREESHSGRQDDVKHDVVRERLKEIEKLAISCCYLTDGPMGVNKQDYFELGNQVFYDMWGNRPSDTARFVINRRDLPEVKRFLEEGSSDGFSVCKLFDGRDYIAKADVYNLGNLYLYCPVYKEAESSHHTLVLGKYPPADPAKLRPEHVKDATIFSLERK